MDDLLNKPQWPSFLTFGRLFTAFQTGNLLFLGIGIAGTRPPAGPNPVTAIISLAAFAVGAAVAMPILKAFDGDQEIEDNDVSQAWPRRVPVALGIALILQVGFFAVWITASSPAHLAYILVALGALAMGSQMNAIRSLHVPGVSTTALPLPSSSWPAVSRHGRSRHHRRAAWPPPW